MGAASKVRKIRTGYLNLSGATLPRRSASRLFAANANVEQYGYAWHHCGWRQIQHPCRADLRYYLEKLIPAMVTDLADLVEVPG
jgi:hypothetical protein